MPNAWLYLYTGTQGTLKHDFFGNRTKLQLKYETFIFISFETDNCMRSAHGVRCAKIQEHVYLKKNCQALRCFSSKNTTQKTSTPARFVVVRIITDNNIVVVLGLFDFRIGLGPLIQIVDSRSAECCLIEKKAFA